MSRMPIILGVSLCAAGCCSAWAAGLTAVPTGTYAVDTEQSRVAAKVAYFGVSSKTVTFPKVAGQLGYDAKAPEAIRLDVNVDATALEAGSATDTKYLRGPDFFNVAAYPTVTFKGTKLKMKSARGATVTGQMIVRGISRPATLDVNFTTPLADISRTGRVVMTAKTSIKRSEFGMKAWSMVVGEKVALAINVQMVRQ